MGAASGFARRPATSVGHLVTFELLAGTRGRSVLRSVAHVVPAARLVPNSAVVTLGARRPGLPFPLSAAAAHGVSVSGDWVLQLGKGDDLQRAVFHVLAPGGRPGRVVKISRVPRADDSFIRDELGLRMAAASGLVETGHAPEHLGRFTAGGLPASAETAASGRPLHELLAAARPARRVTLVDGVAGWLVQMAAATATSPKTLAGELDRLESLADGAWKGLPIPRDWRSRLRGVPGVLQHNDLGTWNVVSDGRDFQVVDWESARRPGLPLWDLLYFLADALVRLEGPADRPTLHGRALDLFRGDGLGSPALFSWLRKAVSSLDIPNDAVGTIAMLGWLHHAMSPADRAGRLGVATAGMPPLDLTRAGLAGAWLTDPLLGAGWDRWRR